MIERRHRLNGIAAAGLFVLLWTVPAAGQTAREVEDVFWRDVVCERELEVRAYLETYPGGAYVSEARACLEQGLGLTRMERVAVQRGLAEVGQEPGPADGLFGGPETKTRRAIRGVAGGEGDGCDGVSEPGAGGHSDRDGAGRGRAATGSGVSDGVCIGAGLW